jgi:hypothetical protein
MFHARVWLACFTIVSMAGCGGGVDESVNAPLLPDSDNDPASLAKMETVPFGVSPEDNEGERLVGALACGRAYF